MLRESKEGQSWFQRGHSIRTWALSASTNIFLLHGEERWVLGWERQQGSPTAAVRTCLWVRAEQREAELPEAGHQGYPLLSLTQAGCPAPEAGALSSTGIGLSRAKRCLAHPHHGSPSRSTAPQLLLTLN